MVATSPGVASADSTSSATSTDGGADQNTDSANTGTTGTGTTGTGTGTVSTAESNDSPSGSSPTGTASTTKESTNTSGATSSSIQVAPGVTISANSIKIGSKTITLGVGGLKPPTRIKPPVADESTESPTAEGNPPAAATPETGQKVSTPVKTESKSTSSAAGNSAASSLVTAAPTPKSPVAAVADALKTVDHLSAKVVEPEPVAAIEEFTATTASKVLTIPTANAVVAPVTPGPAATRITTGAVGFLNQVVTNLLNPFLAPAPAHTPEPVSPVVWAVLGWVRRNLFNQAPTINYNPATTTQTEQTVTGYIGATDPENDALTYTVTQQPIDPATGESVKGTLTVDQATGKFTFTPDDINYDSAQQVSFTVSVTDGNKVNLLGLATPRTDEKTIEFEVKPPTVERVVLTMPDFVKNPANPRFSEDGQSIFFSGTPTAGGRAEIYQIDVNDVDGSTVQCVTCGATPTETANLLKPVPFTDGTGRVLVLLTDSPAGPRYSVYEPAGYSGNAEARLVPVVTPPGGGLAVINQQREMRVSPDGTHVLFTRIVVGQTGGLQALPIVGGLESDGMQYNVTDAVVVWPTGEGKQWTPDGKGVIIQGGAIDAGNVDDIMVDLSGQTGEEELFPGSSFRGIRVTGNLDYDEDIDMSPNGQWIAVGSTRGFEALTPMTRIQRQNFLPVYVGAAVYAQYADNQVVNVSNQTWAVAVQDDLNRENGIPLFVQDDPTTPGIDEGDGWAARSMPSWNADGTAVTFWESGNGDEHGVAPTESRIVIANLKYTTSVGPVGDTTTTVDTSAFPALATYVAKPTPLPPTGTYNGVGGGTAVVTESIDAVTHQTTRTVEYTNYVNEDGLILNGKEWATYGPSQSSVTYNAHIVVTDASGANRGSLDATNAVVNAFTQSVTGGSITSTLDGDTQSIPDPAKAEAAKTGA
ncbi:hypothetical protein DVS77_05865 [Mycolicibacterium moriokaense]|nr:hypothetical protein DVS77_05865 [Mycolicibacterium moriokaense]